MNAHHVPKKVSLDRELSVILDEALDYTGGLPGSAISRKKLATVAIMAVCQEIVNRGKMVSFAFGVTLREETLEEFNARCVCAKLEEGFEP